MTDGTVYSHQPTPGDGVENLTAKVTCRTQNRIKKSLCKSIGKKKGGLIMALTVQDLLEAGCHFGHQTKRWNPKMKDYVYGAKNGIFLQNYVRKEICF